MAGWEALQQGASDPFFEHGRLPAPNVEQLLESDPEIHLAGGPMHDPCGGEDGGECDAMCVCDGDA